MAAVVKFDNVSVRFILEHQRPRSLQDALIGLLHKSPSLSEEFWALREISLAVAAGEALGIIGQNGSGKSTLLKLITRILEPTLGTVDVAGKVSALIELGAGFHPDLTGRENIYLNGSIMGFGRNQMDRLFDDIVSFSELERFIDTPVKHYSSGMYLRLGFSVATSVDPDILIIDEVLSVGDAIFQAKCMERIGEFRRRGKTLIFVSHALPEVELLCDRVIWLQGGRIRDSGPSHTTVDHYQTEFVHKTTLQSGDRRDAESTYPNGHALVPLSREKRLAAVPGLRLFGEDGIERSAFETGDTVVVRFKYSASESHRLRFDLAVHREDGVLIHRTDLSPSRGWVATGRATGMGTARIGKIPLSEGRYIVSLAARDNDSRPTTAWMPDWVREFEITNSTPESGSTFLEIGWESLDVECRTVPLSSSGTV